MNKRRRSTIRILDEWKQLWESAVDEKRNRVRLIVDGSGLVFFFKFKEGLYGGNENARVTYAKMRDSKDEDGKGWKQDANFISNNVLDMITGKQGQTIFGMEELKDIEVIADRQDVIELCLKQFENEPTK